MFDEYGDERWLDAKEVIDEFFRQARKADSPPQVFVEVLRREGIGAMAHTAPAHAS